MKALILILWTLMISLPVFGQTKMVVHKANGEKDTLLTSSVEKITFFKSLTDIDGNIYQVVQIGNQLWTVENLRTTKYNDGTAIPNLIGNTEWATTTSGAYCAMLNDENNVDTYGYLYNWYAVNTGKLAPEGWRVPTDSDWSVLTDFVGEATAGTKLKTTSGWYYVYEYNTGNGTDEFGFSALPGGYRDYNVGTFHVLHSDGYWWSSHANTGSTAFYRQMNWNQITVYRYYKTKRYGFSVRLVRDVP